MNIAIKPTTITTARALAGQVSLVTGSTSGIGLGIARALAAAGSDDRSQRVRQASKRLRTHRRGWRRSTTSG